MKLYSTKNNFRNHTSYHLPLHPGIMMGSGKMHPVFIHIEQGVGCCEGKIPLSLSVITLM